MVINTSSGGRVKCVTKSGLVDSEVNKTTIRMCHLFFKESTELSSTVLTQNHEDGRVLVVAAPRGTPEYEEEPLGWVDKYSIPKRPATNQFCFGSLTEHESNTLYVYTFPSTTGVVLL